MRAIVFALLAAAAVAAEGSTAKRGASLKTAAYGNAQIVVLAQGKGVPTAKATAVYPNAASGAAISAVAGTVLQISFSVADATSKAALSPHQAFVQLENVRTGTLTTFVVPPDASVHPDVVGVHALKLDLSDRKVLHTAADEGQYKVFVVVGDASIANPARWYIGTVDLHPVAAPPKPALPLYSAPLLHESDIALKPLKEIQHQFREPEKRPPAIFSLAAAAVIVVGLVAFVGFVTTIPGFSIHIPLSASFWTVGFYISFASILGLFVLYWFSLNMFTMLTYLLGLSAPAFLFGHRMLAALQHKADETK